MAEEFVSLEKALKELRLKEEELKRLVSEGEIRAFRDADKMKFKKADIEKLKQDTGKTIQFQDESSDTLTEDLLFDEDLELDDADDIGMATRPISSDETFVDDAPAPTRKAKARPSKGGGTSKTKAARAKTKTEPAAASRGSSTTTIRRTTGRSTRILQEAQTAKSEIGAVWLIPIILTAGILAYTGMFWWDICTGEMSTATETLATKISETFVK